MLLTQKDYDDITVVRSNCGHDRIKNDELAKNIFPLPQSNHNFQESPNAETMFDASNIKIAVDMVVADSGATGHFVIVGTNVSDKKISGKTLTSNLPDVNQFK